MATITIKERIAESETCDMWKRSGCCDCTFWNETDICSCCKEHASTGCEDCEDYDICINENRGYEV